MRVLKLTKLPDRTPVKITIMVSPELNRELLEYREVYKAVYLGEGEAEPLTELIPYMLQSFLESDRGFAKARKKAASENAEVAHSPKNGRPTRGSSASST